MKYIYRQLSDVNYGGISFGFEWNSNMEIKETQTIQIMASANLTCLHFLGLTLKFQVWWFLMRVFTYYVSQASEIKVKNM